MTVRTIRMAPSRRFYAMWNIACVMKPTMAVATATEPAAATATATAPTPEMRPNPARNGTMVRTIQVDFDQSGEMSVLISRLIVQQRWAYNMAVQETLKDPGVTFYDLCGMLTKWRDSNGWLVCDDDAQAAGLRQACDSRVQRAGLRQGLDAVQKFMDSNAKKRSNKTMWKKWARHDREREAKKAAKLVRNDGDGASNGANDGDTGANLQSNRWSNKRNRWSHKGDLFRRKGGRQSLCVFKSPVSKGNSMVMLPGVGTVRVHGDVEGLDMRSFQLVETTKKITRLTEDHNRTYRLHIQVGVKAPKPSESAVIRGVDMGIVHGATTVDLDTGHHAFHDIPKDCRRTKNDEISRMQAVLSRKRGGSGNRRIRQNGNGGGRDGNANGKQDNASSINMKARRGRPRRPKSRGYKELQRKIQKKRENVANRQTNWERHASKNIADGAGTVSMEDLNLKNMTAKAKGKGSSAKAGLNRGMAYSRPGTFQRQIEGACANAGVMVITVDPKWTSITCHVCGHKDRDSRTSQGEFHCTNDKCNNDINADINAAHNIAVKATAGRPGRSSQGARFQRGIAPARSANNMREASMGGIAGAPEKDRSTVYFCI